MTKIIKTQRYGIICDNPLYTKNTLMNVRAEFIKVYNIDPTHLIVSPKCFNDLRAFAERYEYPFGFEVKIDHELEDEKWIVGIEESKVSNEDQV